MHSFIKVVFVHTFTVSTDKSLPGMKPFGADGKYVLITVVNVKLAIHLHTNIS